MLTTNKKKSLTIIGCVLLSILIILLLYFNLGKDPQEPFAREENSSEVIEADTAKHLRPEDITSDLTETLEAAHFTPPVFDQYENRTVSVTLPSGSVLTIGTETDDGKALYLNPCYDCVDDEIILNEETTHFGFYITSTLSSDIEWSSEETYVHNAEDCPKNGLITDRTYDTVVDAAFKDPDRYGVKWTDSNNIDGSHGSDHTLLFRIVRFPDGWIMGCCKAAIKWDSTAHKYLIESLYVSDAAMNGDISEEMEANLIETAFSFFASDEKGQTTPVDDDSWELNKYWATVQKVQKTYFPKLFDAKGEVTIAGKYTNLDIFAVSFNYPGYGIVTVYFAPRRQLDGLRNIVPPTEELIPFGYDALHPESRDTMLVPPWQAEEFFD